MSQMVPHQNMMTQSFSGMTRFGAMEIPDRSSLEQPLKNRYLVRIDTLAVLRQIWGENILMSRDLLYTLVSGNTDDDHYRNILSSYYARFNSFANYVDEKYYFESPEIPLIARIIKPARAMIDQYAKEVALLMENHSGVFVGQSHDYLYYSFKHTNIPEVEGKELLC